MAVYENLLKLSCDELFEKYSIEEIMHMYKELQFEIDKKRNELRILVGEKYRDFIKSATTIDLMNKSKTKVINKIENVTESLLILNSSFEACNEKLLSLKNCAHINDADITENTVIILIKLLTDLENQIWNRIDADNFIAATALLQLAKHIKKLFDPSINSEMKKKFLVFNDIWNTMSYFPIILIKIIEEKLKIFNLSSQITCECLISLAILENIDAMEVIKKFLNFRTDSLQHTLNLNNVTSNVKNHIFNSFHIITHTFVMLYSNFNNDNESKGQYWIEIENIKNLNFKSVIKNLKLDFCTRSERISVPVVIQNFKIESVNLLKPIDVSQCNKCIDEWLSQIIQYCILQIPTLLNLIGSLKTLFSLKESAPFLPENWSTIMVYFNQNSTLDIWREVYQPLIIERTKQILFIQWNAVFDNICTEIKIIVETLGEKSSKESEKDLHTFLWDLFEDNMLKKSTQRKFLNKKGSMFKCSGLSSNSKNICNFIDSLLFDTVQELSSLCSVTESEYLELQNYQQICCLELIEKLLTYCNDMGTSDDHSENLVLFLARILCGLSYIHKSLMQSISLDNTEKWLNIDEKLQKTTMNFWKMWYSDVLDSLSLNFNYQITFLLLDSLRLNLIPKWNITALNGSIEDGEEIKKSFIKIPSQASFSIQNLLHSLSSLISCTLPPENITKIMKNNLMIETCKSIEKITEKSSYHQTIYIQLLFDLKYMIALLISFENQDLTTQCCSTINKLESKIDPVDLNIVLSHISDNVKLFIEKTQCLFGLLISNKIQFKSVQCSESDIDPNIVCSGATDIPYFPLLPISSVYLTKKD